MNSSAHRCELHSGPDNLGRYSYSLHWWTDYTPGHPEGEHVRRERGQHFFGIPPDDVTQEDHRPGKRRDAKKT